MVDELPSDLTTKQVLDLIFRDPDVLYGLSEFTDLEEDAHDILKTFPKNFNGPNGAETRYYLRCFKRDKDIQVLSKSKSNPEEIIRQLWLHKLQQNYEYPLEHIEVEYPVVFGTEVSDKLADIIVFQKDGKTAKIVLETKRPARKEGISQLKSYLNAEGSPVGVWSNGQDRVILFRPYPREFEDTLTEIPRFDQQPVDVFSGKLTLADLRREFDFKRIVQDLEELVLANAGVDEFNEIFKIIFAKIYDEIAADDRDGTEVRFRKSDDPQVTWDNINKLFRKAVEEWPGIFDDAEEIDLSQSHLQVVVGPLERIRLRGSNMRIMDDAFEYLMPTIAKRKNGQYFTPRYVVDMCVKILRPSKTDYVLDPACGSGGFLIHAMEYVYPAPDDTKKEERQHKYAAKYLWGLDFDKRSAKVAKALMLIAGDGYTHVFRTNALDPREWFSTADGDALRNALRDANLVARRPPPNRALSEAEAWDFYRDLKFDIILTNPPFAGEIRDRELLKRYELCQRQLSKTDVVEERDVLFLERCLQLLKQGGRLAIVLPQSKLNNSTYAYIRDWILRRGRILAIVGLHPHTFKPHAGTKTSVLFLQKYTASELSAVRALEEDAEARCPRYEELLRSALKDIPAGQALRESQLPEEVLTYLRERFGTEEERRLSEGASEQTVELEQLTKELERLTESPAPPSRNGGGPGPATLRGMNAGKQDKVRIRLLRKKIARLQQAQKTDSLEGQVTLLLEDRRALRYLRERWIALEVAKELNYEIFMATSERGGKNSSGGYVYRKGPQGETLTDEEGNPVVDQDCIQYRDGDPIGIADQFGQWAKSQRLAYWADGG